MRIGTPEFTNWMRAQPRPDRVKAYLESGKPRIVKVRPRKGVRYWKEVVDALSAYEVMSVELLDEDGNVLRNMQTEAAEVQETPEEGRASRRAASAATDDNVPAEVIASTATTGETRLVEFARLLERAFTTGATMQQKASAHAFDKLVELTNIAFQRLDTLERAYNRVFKRRVAADADDDESGTNETAKVIETLVTQRVLQQMGMNGIGGETPGGEGG